MNTKTNRNNSLEKLLHNKQPVILDGAMGTLLESRGYILPEPQWSAAVLETRPNIITSIHEEYIRAGANIITTASFRTTTRVYRTSGDSVRARELNSVSVQCARDACRGYDDVLVAGSVAPLEDCFRPDLVPSDPQLYDEHKEQVVWLIDAGIDCLLFETMNTIREARICAGIAQELDFPFIVSVVCNSSSSLISGESILNAAEVLMQYTPLIFSINCTAPKYIEGLLNSLRERSDYQLGVYANVGTSEPEQRGEIEAVISPREYLDYVGVWMQYGISLIGGCCGSTPAHIQILSEKLDFRNEGT